MPLVRPSLALVLLAALAWPTPAAAGQPRRRGNPQDEARDLYKKGMTHYEVGEFDTAIGEFKRAYELTSAPGLLFNIAQVYRMKKDPEQALYFYRTYLRRVPDAANKGDVVALIEENQKLLERQQQQRTAEPPPPAAPAPSVAAPAPSPNAPAPSVATPAPAPMATRPAPPRRRWRVELWTGVALGAVGVGALAAGSAMAARAASDNRQLDAANAQGDVPWDATQQQRYTDGTRANAAAIALFAAGGALAATGAVLGALGLHDRAAARGLALVPSTTGASVVMSCVF